MSVEKCEKVISLIVTHIEEDACTFWAQVNSPSIKTDLEKLSLELEKLSSSSSPLCRNPVKEQYYGCPFVDGYWYRCRVLFAMPNGKYLVQYADYGNCEEKFLEYLIPLPERFQMRNMKPLAHRFHLHNISISAESIKPAQAYIEKMCSTNFVKAKLVTDLTVVPTEVVLYDEQSLNVCEYLLKSGMACPANKPETKKNVVMSAPMLAQKYKNPLITPLDESSDDNNNKAYSPIPTSRIGSQSSGIESPLDSSDIGSGGDGPIIKSGASAKKCKDCERCKEDMLRMKLIMKKMQHELQEAEQKVKTLSEKEDIWRMKYLSLKEQRGDMLKTSLQEKTVNDQPKDDLEDVSTESKNGNQQQQLREEISIMKKTVFPALEFTKKLVGFNKIIEDCKRSEQSLKSVVLKMKSHIAENRKATDEDFLSLVGLRNSVVRDLKQYLAGVGSVCSDLENNKGEAKADNYINQLHELAPDIEPIHPEEVKVQEITKLIQIWKMKQGHEHSLKTIVTSMLACIQQQNRLLHESSAFLKRVPALKGDIEKLEVHDKLVDGILDVGKSIRKLKQKVRILLATLRNFEEEEKESSSQIGLREQIQKTKTELSACRRELQENFERKWLLMESVSEIAERFTPELEIEHPEIGIVDYFGGKGIVMHGMELDHFDISKSDWDDRLQLECYHTTYRKQPIILHKYLLHSINNDSLSTMLEEIAAYSNIDSPYLTAPLGVFFEKDIAYIMIGQPPDGVLLSDLEKVDEVIGNKILKQVASSIHLLHQSEIAHGQVSADSVMVHDSTCFSTSLLVPNFKLHPDKRAILGGPMKAPGVFAHDVYSFGLLAKRITENCEAGTRLKNLVQFCRSEFGSSDYSMEQVLLKLEE